LGGKRSSAHYCLQNRFPAAEVAPGGVRARQAGAVSATRGLSPRDALVGDALGLGLGQRIDAGALGLGVHDFAAIDVTTPGMRIAVRGRPRRARRLTDVRQDLLVRAGVSDERDDPHRARVVRTGQREGFIHARRQYGPQIAGLAAPACTDPPSPAVVSRRGTHASASCSGASAVTVRAMARSERPTPKSHSQWRHGGRRRRCVVASNEPGHCWCRVLTVYGLRFRPNPVGHSRGQKTCVN